MIESWVGGTARILPEAIRRAGHHYTFVTRKPSHYGGRFGAIADHPVLAHADDVLTLETNDTGELIAQLREVHRKLRFGGVMTICDYYIETVTEVAAVLGLPCPFPLRVAQQRRKHLVRASLDRAGLPNPAYRVTRTYDEARSAAQTIGYPLVVKPCDLASSAFVRLVTDERELREAVAEQEAFALNFRGQRRDGLCLLEEYLHGPEVSVEACGVHGDTTVIGITDKSVTAAPHFVEDGHMFPAALDSATALEVATFARKALAATGHDHGVSHTEVKLTPAGPRLVEINPRLPGNYIVELIRHVTGVDLLATTVALTVGEQPDLTSSATGVQSAAIRFVIPPRAGHIVAVRGTEVLDTSADVVRWQLDATEDFDVVNPIDNACYLGHVVTIDRGGQQARAFAEHAVDALELIYDDVDHASVLETEVSAHDAGNERRPTA